MVAGSFVNIIFNGAVVVWVEGVHEEGVGGLRKETE